MPVTPAPTAGPAPDAQWHLENLRGHDVMADPTPWIKAYETVHADSLHLPDHRDPTFGERLAFSAARPGFRLTSCRVDGEPAGFAYGYTLPATTGWWDGFEPLPGVDADETVRERPGRTLALCEVLVHERFRGFGVARRTLTLLLGDRREERAAALVSENNTRALDLFLDNGPRHVGDLAPHPGWRRHHGLVRPLRP
ncbi:GNAT family N-acetyltransferase [Nocardiopsis sp. L17-MgMaSL7]|uniref:GNAT family N-acetyltransferase n=1 Tax=Nocardiopsis sp. L17-MgMaSL7 TaxID=1938893 RepID=UPI000D711217|nr:GNAT family N-acetyltransferase [Nocardiopsis sp. L17-MgMaSL7]PWV55474.1 acetyltransferase (GNAT) family protein [Nocardiopsis sp. L17-MgMaSL7]